MTAVLELELLAEPPGRVNERFVRACPRCRRPLVWTYRPTHGHAQVIERAECVEHGELDSWVVLDRGHVSQAEAISKSRRATAKVILRRRFTDAAELASDFDLDSARQLVL